jgi:uncharacterized Zn-binding protein involved in type VI secretion
MSHCDPKTAAASGDVYAYSKGAHRNGDARDCGAATIVGNQGSVWVNGKLWSVLGDQCSHGNGDLINSSGSSVYVEGIPVIVNGPDDANPDDLCGEA